MQINPFGFPLGNGLGAAPSAGAAQTDFAAVLGLAFGNAGNAGFAANAALPGEQPNAAIDLGATTDLAPAFPAAPATDGVVLPGLQTPTPLSQLMATAARLPAAEPAAAPVLPAATETPLLPAAPAIEAAPKAVVPEAAPAEPAIAAPVEALPSLPAQPAAEAVAPQPAAPVESAVEPVTPRKPGHAAEDALPDEAQPEADATAQPAAIPAAALVPQPPVAQAQPQRTAPRGESTPTLGTPARKGAAGLAAAQPQTQPGTAPVHATSESSFERAVAAADTGTPSDGSPQQHEGQAPELRVASAAARHDAPAMPQHVQYSASATTPAAVPASEPVLTARAGHLGQSLGVEVARKVEAGEETLRVRLSPEHLGKVEVTLAFDDGKLQATVRAESAHALELLRQDAGDLARTLDQAGIRTDAQSFRFEARADGGSGQAASQQQNSNRGGEHQQHAHSDDLEPAPAYRQIRGDGQVDLLA
jgi:flagellar hook-length control protein FliK